MAFVAYFLSGFCFVVLLKLEVVQTFSTHSLRYTTEEGLTTKGYMDTTPTAVSVHTFLNISSEQRLMNFLLKKYENSVRPIYNSSRPVEVNLGLTLTQILDLAKISGERLQDHWSSGSLLWLYLGNSQDEKNQVLTTNVWLEVEWHDEKLVWDKEDFEGMDSIRVPCKKIWLPDIVLYNSVDDYTSGYMPSLAMVHSDGRVFWGPVVRFRSSCKIDITFFPFDDQICYLKLGSWAYNGYQVNVNKRSETIDLSNYVDNGEWMLIGAKITRSMVIYNCCVEPFPDVMFYFRLRRRVKYYFMNIIIPCIILSFLCLAGFCLPPESGEKITLGLSVLLTITVFMLMVADKMPQTSESISIISIYLMVVLTMSCLSILFSVAILSLHHQRGEPRRVPNIVRCIAFSIIAPILCLKLKSTKIKRNVIRQNSTIRKKSFTENMPDLFSLDGHCNCPAMQPLHSADEYETFRADDNGTCDLELKQLQERQDTVNDLINWLHRKHKSELNEDISFQEWRDVAFVADRLLFVLFLVLNITATAIILSMRPQQDISGFNPISVSNT